MNGSNPDSYTAGSANAGQAHCPSLDFLTFEDKILYLRLKHGAEPGTLGRLDVHALPSARETFNGTARGHSAAQAIKAAQTLVNNFRMGQTPRPWSEWKEDESIDVQPTISSVDLEVAGIVQRYNSTKEIGELELALTWVPEEELEAHGCEHIPPREIDGVSRGSTQASLPTTNAALPG